MIITQWNYYIMCIIFWNETLTGEICDATFCRILLLTDIRQHTRYKSFITKSVELNFFRIPVPKDKFQHTLKRNISLWNLWKWIFPERKFQNTWHHTLERNDFIVKSVELNFPRIPILKHICQHTLERNLFIVKSVKLIFPRIPISKHTC